MRKQKPQYVGLFILTLLMSIPSIILAQIKEKRQSGFYKTVEKSTFKVTDPYFMQELFLDTVPICSVENFKKIRLGWDEMGMPLIEIKLNDKGAENFAKATKDNIGKPLPLIANGELLLAPVIQSEINGGSISITYREHIEQAKEIIDKIKRELPERLKTKDEEQISQLCSDFDSALIKKDIEKLKRLLDDSISFPDRNGLIERNKKLTKDDLLKHLNNGYIKFNTIEQQQTPDIDIINNEAFVKRHLTISITRQGEEFTRPIKVLETWEKNDKNWKLVKRERYGCTECEYW